MNRVVPVSAALPHQYGAGGAARRPPCGWCDSTHVADAHGCSCREDCGVGWCCAVADLREVTPL